MERVMLVEELNRRGRVRRLTPVEELPFKIGRGYDCDLILDDPHVSPLHGVVERDPEGGLVLRDAGSRNGISREHERAPVASVALEGDVLVQLGRTSLRFRAPDFPVGEALSVVRRSALSHWLLNHWGAAVSLTVAYLALSQLGAYRATTAEYDPAFALSDALTDLLLIAGWVGSWALLNRLLRHQTRIVAHTSVACTIFIAYLLADWGVEWLRFVVPPIEPLQLLDLFVTAAAFGLILAGHLSVMGVARPLRRAGAALMGFLALITYQLIDHFQSSEIWVHTLPYWSRLKPVDPSWLPAETDTDFFEAIPALQAELAERAREIAEERTRDPE